MADSWSRPTIGDLCDQGEALIQTGPFGSQLHAHDYEPVGVPVVPTEAIGQRRLRTEGLPKVSTATAERLSRHKLKESDILFARRGVQATGLSAIVEKEHEGWLCGTGAILLRLNSPDVDAEFLSFALSSEASTAWLKSHAVGAVMPNLNEGVIRRFPLLLPPIAEQQAIAHILGTLDDKIELNRRMNETLEAIACALFKSWFVDFDPVRAKAEKRQPAGMDAETAALFPSSFEEAPFGIIPQGWLMTPLPQVIEVNPRRSLAKGQSAPYVDMQNMPTRGHRVRSWMNRPFGSGTKFLNGDTLVARITPCLENGKTAFVDFLDDEQVGWGSTEYIILRPKKPLPLEYGYYLARSEEFRFYAIQQMTGSSGRQRVPAECFANFHIAYPSKPIAERFSDITHPLMKTIRANVMQSATLAKLRDALLPKLLSGEIRVREAERQLV